MDKKFMQKFIDDSIIVEELAIPIYKKHIDSALFWSGFSPEKEQFIRDSLVRLTEESEKHVKMLTALKSLVDEED